MFLGGDGAVGSISSPPKTKGAINKLLDHSSAASTSAFKGQAGQNGVGGGGGGGGGGGEVNQNTEGDSMDFPGWIPTGEILVSKTCFLE